MHIFIWNRSGQNPCREVVATDGPPRLGKAHFLKIMRIYPLPLTPTTDILEPSRGIDSKSRRPLEGPRVSSCMLPLLLLSPHLRTLPTTSLHGCACLCSVPYTLDVLLLGSSSLPSPNFHPGILPQSSAAHRGGEEGRKEERKEPRKGSWLMLIIFARMNLCNPHDNPLEAGTVVIPIV